MDWPDLGDEVVLSRVCRTGFVLFGGGGGGGGLYAGGEAGGAGRGDTAGAGVWGGGVADRVSGGVQPQVRTVVFLEGNDLEVMLAKHKRRGVKMVGLKFPDYKAGCRMLKKALVSEQIRLRKSQFLRMAVAASRGGDVVLTSRQLVLGAEETRAGSGGRVEGGGAGLVYVAAESGQTACGCGIVGRPHH